MRQSRPGNLAMAPRRATVCLLLAALVCAATATIFLEEKFDDGAPCCLAPGQLLVGPRSGTGRCCVKAPVPSAACWLYHRPHCGAAAVAAHWVAVAACGLTQAGQRGPGRGCFRTSFADPARLAFPPCPGAAWEKRWVKSNWKVKDGTAGDWTLTPGKWFGDAKADAGIQTGPDARFFAIAAPFKKPVDTEGKTLVLQARGQQP